MASPVEKSTGDAIFQNWRAVGETSRLFCDPPPFCFSRPRAPTVSVSSGLMRRKRATWSKSNPLQDRHAAPGIKRGVKVPLSRNLKVSYDWLIAGERKWQLGKAEVRVGGTRTSPRRQPRRLGRGPSVTA